MKAQSPTADEAIVRQIFAMNAAGNSNRIIGLAVGLSITGVRNILIGRSRRAIAPDLPRLGEPGAAPQIRRRQVPKAVKPSCRACRHWDETRVGAEVVIDDVRQKLNPCTLGYPEPTQNARWRVGYNCPANTAHLEEH